MTDGRVVDKGRGASRLALAAAALVLVGACSDAGDEAAADTTTTTVEPSTTTTTDSTSTTGDPAVAAAWTELEETYGARLGVYAIDTGTGEAVAHRADERFAYASTHKALSVAAVLRATEPDALDDIIRFDASDVVVRSPVTERHVETGMTLLEVMHAAITVSDNTAGNLLLEQLGGPEGFEAALRAVGDETTSADRWEPELGDWAPGETRDTTTPRAMAENLERFVLGDVLDEHDRTVLVEALRDTTTGDELIRAAVPEGWVVGDKTGSASHGGRNDIAVIEPPDGDPIVLAVYSNRRDPEAESDPALIAAAAAIVLDELAG